MFRGTVPRGSGTSLRNSSRGIIEVVDLFHGKGLLWDAAGKPGEQWGERRDKLDRGGTHAVLAALSRETGRTPTH